MEQGWSKTAPITSKQSSHEKINHILPKFTSSLENRKLKLQLLKI